MSTPASIPLTPGVRIRFGTTLTAVGVLLAIAMTVTVLALTSSDHTAGAPPAAASYAVDSTPQVHYLGPGQLRAAARNAYRGGGTTPIAGGGDPAPHYICLAAAQRAQACLR